MSSARGESTHIEVERSQHPAAVGQDSAHELQVLEQGIPVIAPAAAKNGTNGKGAREVAWA